MYRKARKSVVTLWTYVLYLWQITHFPPSFFLKTDGVSHKESRLQTLKLREVESINEGSSKEKNHYKAEFEVNARRPKDIWFVTFYEVLTRKRVKLQKAPSLDVLLLEFFWHEVMEYECSWTNLLITRAYMLLLKKYWFVSWKRTPKP